MKIVRIHPGTGVRNQRELPVTAEELQRWQQGELCQQVWPHLSPADREFIMTGLLPEDWPAEL